MLPAPVGVVLDFDVVEDDAAFVTFEDNVRVGHNFGTLELVLALAFLAWTLPAATTAALGALPLLFIEAHLVAEAADHGLPELSLLLDVLFGPLVMGFAGIEALFFSMVLPLLLGLPPCLLHLLPVGLLAGLLLIEHSNNHRGSAASLSNLEEGVVMTKRLFALSAVVEVFANSTLVANADDG